MKPDDRHRPIVTLHYPMDMGLQAKITRLITRHYGDGNLPFSGDGTTMTVFVEKEPGEREPEPPRPGGAALALYRKQAARLTPHDRPWREYPVGTKAHNAVSGGHWIKVGQGAWRWHTGDTFPTPGADAFGNCIELPTEVPLKTE